MTIADDILSITYLPHRGGKIVSLIDATGREWLLQPKTPVSPVVGYGANFVAAGVFGWDECAPTIDACSLADGRSLPDHGEVWSAHWQDDGAGCSKVSGVELDYWLSRSICVADGKLTIDYEVVGTGAPCPFMWTSHPLFVAPPGTAVVVGDTSRLVDVTDTEITPLPPGDRVDIDAVPRGHYRKLYNLAATRLQSASIHLATGASLEMRWAALETPHLGIYLDHGCYCPEPAIALEPSTSWFDSLARAEANGSAVLLTEGVRRAWSITVNVATHE